MLRSRPAQYLALLLLVLASLAIIYIPVGPRPTEQSYNLRLTAPKPLKDLAGPKKDVTELANTALTSAFPVGQGKLPGALIVQEGAAAGASKAGAVATIQDTATTRGEAQARAERIVRALSEPFPGIKLDATENTRQMETLAETPLFSLGQYALYAPKRHNGTPIPAIKLGLDLQGGVNLVLQMRRALFTYTFDQKLGDSTDKRDAFISQVRDALSKAPADTGLGKADVNLVPGESNALEIRTQAKDRNEFTAQGKAIEAALQQAFAGVKFTADREPQFFEPDESVGQSLGFNNGYAKEMLDRTVEIVRSRVDRLGVSEPLIQTQAPDRIIVQLPGLKNPQQAVDIIGKTAQMEIRLLPQNLTPIADRSDPNNTLFQDDKGNIVPSSQVRREATLIVRGADLKPTTTAGTDQGGQPAIFFELEGDGARKFGAETAKNVGRIMPIFLDDRCISAPNIQTAITGGKGQISGGFKDIEEARSLAVLLNSGALPAPIDVIENRTVSATLGTDSLVQSLRAGLIGIIAVAIFMVCFYRLPGMLANCALVIYCIVNLATFILVGGTLTLPGIAGFLLALAMSLDTNILVFERLREEMAIQPTFVAALRAAFSRAWTAILDSHVTTLIAATVLFFLGTGPIKGFALTLGIGVLLSLFSAITVTRIFMWSAAGLGERSKGLFPKPIEESRASMATTLTK